MSARPNRFAESGFRQGFQRSNCEKIPADAPQFKIDGATRVDLPRTLPGPRPNFKVRAARLQTLCFNVSAIIRHRTVNLRSCSPPRLTEKPVLTKVATAASKIFSYDSTSPYLPLRGSFLAEFQSKRPLHPRAGSHKRACLVAKKNQLSYHRSYRREGINSHRLEDPARPDEAG